MIEDIEREQALFESALEIVDAMRRGAFLEEACGGDATLLGRVEKLLSASESAERFFDGCVPTEATVSAALEASQFGVEDHLAPDGRVGCYKFLQKIGEGGCGAVFMAEQVEPVRRRVALKVIKLGMDTKSVIARFEAERQALAMMDHPNIARVLDAGATETGRPYFVMELVTGVRITEYCDQNRLGLEQRLELLIQICHAIQHAHQKGIIHRDIKPSNILVTVHDGTPAPKVIDFGIAKATQEQLTDKTLFTAYAQLIGTPAYMSPEQAELGGLDIDTRSDIYSLGVLLYELITGYTPFNNKELLKSGVDEMRRTLREREPCSPSAKLNTLAGDELTRTAIHCRLDAPRLIGRVRGDLDWIAMKALEKDRSRRYETADAFAMDIRRFLDNEPILARPPSRWYQFGKLIRRNRVVFAAGAAVAAALLVCAVSMTWLWLKEREAWRRAVAAQRETEAARDSLVAASKIRASVEWYAWRNQWPEAAALSISLVQVDLPDDPEFAALDYLSSSVILAEMGQTAQYEHLRDQAIARFKDMANLTVAERIIATTLLRPADASVIAALKPLAQVERSPFTAPGRTTAHDKDHPWELMVLALFEYRGGDYAKAADLCRRCVAAVPDAALPTPSAHVILAMSLHRLGQEQAAYSELGQARAVIEGRFKTELDQAYWRDWVFARVLLREATALLAEDPAQAPHSLRGPPPGQSGTAPR